jgi:hypothetical protein
VAFSHCSFLFWSLKSEKIYNKKRELLPNEWNGPIPQNGSVKSSKKKVYSKRSLLVDQQQSEKSTGNDLHEHTRKKQKVDAKKTSI